MGVKAKRNFMLSRFGISTKATNPLKTEDGHILFGAATMGNCLADVRTNQTMVAVLEEARKQLIQTLNLEDTTMPTTSTIPVEKAAPPSIFICYSHRDTEYLTRLLVHLKALQRKVELKVWVDTQLKNGDIWKPQIIDSIKKASAAILLVLLTF